MTTTRPWFDLELYATVGAVPDPAEVAAAYADEAETAFRAIDRTIGAWYAAHRTAVDGLYLFHYRDVVRDAARVQHAAGSVPPVPFFSEFSRLRFRPADGIEPDRLFEDFRSAVLVPLCAGPDPVMRGWSSFDGYTARDDVGARYGDLAGGVDPTETVVRILTANTELRFQLLDHPGFQPNHDIAHLYLSTMGLTLAQEAEALRACIAKVEGWDAAFRRRLAEAGENQGRG